jgi:hypothetical protein
MACDDLHQLDITRPITSHGCQSSATGQDTLKDVIVLPSVAMANELLNRVHEIVNAVQMFEMDVPDLFFHEGLHLKL